ncbi:MAG: P-II family nitrogen regulator [Lachnospiraceae bacterium]|nr:P-II family nitrogen regulator [Lachnospiraceae bacterium]MBQ8117849.1 P-II family nitrogen regulator [Lachnospiraceae bacterium]
MKNANYQMIFCVVNAGFSQVVMEAARSAGARGGTLIHGRGTANKEAEKRFHIVVQPDKEIVMILVNKEIKDDVMIALNKAVGLETAGQGIAFSVPVDRVIGISEDNGQEKKEKN